MGRKIFDFIQSNLPSILSVIGQVADKLNRRRKAKKEEVDGVDPRRNDEFRY